MISKIKKVVFLCLLIASQGLTMHLYSLENPEAVKEAHVENVVLAEESPSHKLAVEPHVLVAEQAHVVNLENSPLKETVLVEEVKKHHLQEEPTVILSAPHSEVKETIALAHAEPSHVEVVHIAEAPKEVVLVEEANVLHQEEPAKVLVVPNTEEKETIALLPAEPSHVEVVHIEHEPSNKVELIHEAPKEESQVKLVLAGEPAAPVEVVKIVEESPAKLVVEEPTSNHVEIAKVLIESPLSIEKAAPELVILEPVVEQVAEQPEIKVANNVAHQTILVETAAAGEAEPCQQNAATAIEKAADKQGLAKFFEMYFYIDKRFMEHFRHY